MKIILCLHHFLPEVIAGTEMYVLRLAQNLTEQGVEAVVLIPNFGAVTNKEYIYEGVRVIKYAENSVEDRKMMMGKSIPAGLAEFSKLLLEEKPDIIHFHELFPGRGINIFHVQKAHLLSIPIVLTFHLSNYTCIKGTLIYKDESKCDGIVKIMRCTECVYHSKKIVGYKAVLLSKLAATAYYAGLDATYLSYSVGTALGFPFVISKIKRRLVDLANYSERIIVLTQWYKKILEDNGVPSHKLVYVKQGLANKTKTVPIKQRLILPLKIVFVGRINELKGIHLLIDAFFHLPEDKITLDIYGQDSEESYASDLKKKSAAKKNIRWMGKMQPEVVINRMSEYHVLCLPSTFSEMSPLVIQEAFAAGLPVLASDVYGNAEEITEGVNGWLFRFKDSSHLTDKLLYLVNNLDKVEKARKELPKPNSFKSVVENHIEIYSMVMKSKKKIGN